MKIGIVTFYRVANYGAMLQAYALWQYLAARGHEVVFIDHSRTSARRIPLWRCLVSRSMKGVVVKLKNYVRFSMTRFAVSYPQTRRCWTLDDVREATADCDAFIVGSDQMWNPMWCSDAVNLPFVMLDFAAEGKRRLAYAASFGTKEWRNDQNAAYAGELLRKFSRISVREESGVALVKRLSGRTDAECLLDPTLLQTVEFYQGIIADACGDGSETSTETYIFRYMLDEWDDAEASQKAFALVQSKLGISRVETDHVLVKGLFGPLCRVLGVTAKIAVPDWISKIARADFVFTNSFHGTVFAILFHKPFVSLLLRGRMSCMNERLLSLLAKLGLLDRAVYADEFGKIEKLVTQAVDWAAVDYAIRTERTATDRFFEYLKSGVV